MDSLGTQQNTHQAIFGGGCFWCTEAVFKELKGVIDVMPGYSGGETPNPTYQSVSGGETGYAEVIKIDYDPSQITFRDLLTVFFATHDPITRNRQGADVGTQYRSVVFYTTPEQKQEAEAYIAELNASSSEGAPIVTEVDQFEAFFEAEDYHKNYYENNKDKMYCQIVINPKLNKLHEKFGNLLKAQS